MHAHLRRGRTNCTRERGSISLWMVTAAMAMIILAGLAVDLGGQVLTRQHAANVAAQAARAGRKTALAIGPSAVKEKSKPSNASGTDGISAAAGAERTAPRS